MMIKTSRFIPFRLVQFGITGLASLFLLLTFTASLHGQTATPPAPDPDEVPLLPGKQVEAIDSGHEAASEMLISAADWFDNFFDDNRYTSEENKSRAKLKLSFAYTENDDFEFNPSLSWRIHLPKISEKANLLISASDDEDFDADDFPGSSPTDEDDKNELSAAIQYFLKETERYNISTTFGGSWNYLYAGLRFRHFKDFGPWQGRFVDRLRYYTDDGWENKMSYDLERRFSEKWLFRSTATGTWYEERDGLPHSLRFRLYQVVSDTSAISYEWVNYFDTEPSHKMTDLQLRLKYRQRFYRDWLVLEIAPQVTFPEDHNRDANLGIILKLEADFGNLEEMKSFNNVFRF